MRMPARITAVLALRTVGELAVVPLLFFAYVTAVALAYDASWTHTSRLGWTVAAPAAAVEQHLSPSAREAWRRSAARLRAGAPKKPLTGDAAWSALDPRRWSLRAITDDLKGETGLYLVCFGWLAIGFLIFGVAIPMGISKTIAPLARLEFRRLLDAVRHPPRP